jgi:integrase
MAWPIYCSISPAIWVKADEATLDGLKCFCRRLSPRVVGMTAKNKKRLQQFADPRILASLLDLPARMFAEACRVEVPTKTEARIAQLALAIEILLMAPIRIKNLSELEIGRTLLLDRSSVGHIFIDGSEVKNESDIEIPMPKTALGMIHTYLKRFHPLLAPPGCMMLFPSGDAGHKRTPVLGVQITRCLRSRCGIAMNPHLFRHLAAKLYLDAFPGAYGIVRMLLGHQSTKITERIYCGTEFAAAFKAYDALLTSRRQGELIVRDPIRARKDRR